MTGTLLVVVNNTEMPAHETFVFDSFQQAWEFVKIAGYDVPLDNESREQLLYEGYTSGETDQVIAVNLDRVPIIRSETRMTKHIIELKLPRRSD